MAADRLASGGEFNLSGPVDSFVEAVLGRVPHPSSLFSGLSRRGDFPSPLLFALVCHEVAAILGGLLALASGNQGGLSSGASCSRPWPRRWEPFCPARWATELPYAACQ